MYCVCVFVWEHAGMLTTIFHCMFYSYTHKIKSTPVFPQTVQPRKLKSIDKMYGTTFELYGAFTFLFHGKHLNEGALSKNYNISTIGIYTTSVARRIISIDGGYNAIAQYNSLSYLKFCSYFLQLEYAYKKCNNDTMITDVVCVSLVGCTSH